MATGNLFTRREFARDVIASLGFSAFGGRLFAAPTGWRPKGEPNLVFGALSDTHIRTNWSGRKPDKRFPIKYFKAALRYFKAANVDAVVHCGDFAHRGMMASMQFHADAWQEVFGGKGPVKLFVSGNHDIEGGTYGDFGAKVFPNPKDREKYLLAPDIESKWKAIWGEPYEKVWHKVVKGYHFFGRQWEVDEMETARFIRGYAISYFLPPRNRPFFYVQHVRSSAGLNKALSKWPNAIGLFGHAHQSAANWNVISLCEGSASVQVPSCEPRGTGKLSGDGWITSAKLEGADAAGSPRQGYVVRVYDDMLVIERREFGEGGSLGPDWIMPLGKFDPSPFGRDELRKAIGSPQFREGAKLSVDSADGLIVSIPHADGNPDSRVYAYELVVAGDDPKARLRRSVYAAGLNMGVGHETNKGVTTVKIAKKDLPPGGGFTLAVRPLSSLGTKGRPIGAKAKV